MFKNASIKACCCCDVFFGRRECEIRLRVAGESCLGDLDGLGVIEEIVKLEDCESCREFCWHVVCVV